MYLTTAYHVLTMHSPRPHYYVQSRKDLDDAVAAKNLLELEIAGYERLLSGTGDGRAVRDKNAIGGVAKALGGMSFAQTCSTTTITSSSGGGFGGAGAGAGGYGAPPGGATYGHTAAGGAPAGPGVGAKAAGYPGAGAGPGGPTYGGPYGASPPTSPPAGLAGGYGGGYAAPPPATVPGGPGDLLFPKASVQPDGMVVGPDGRPLGRVSPTGMVVGPDGRIVGKMGPGGIVGTGPGDVLAANTSVRPDGMVVGPDGRPVGQARPDGMVVGPDGTVLGKRQPDGSVVAPGPGDVLAASTLVQPDGMVMGPDGRPVGKMRGDGMVVGPDGKVVGQMTPNGAVVGASPGGQPGWTESAASVHRFPWHKPSGGAQMLQSTAPAPMNYGQQAVHAAPPPDSGLQGIYRDVTQGLKDIYFRGAPQAGPNQPQGAAPPGAGYGGPAGGAPPMLSASGGGMPTVGAAADLSGLSEFKLLTDEGPVVVRARSSGTAAYLKQMIQAQLFLSPRLTLTLTTGGNTGDGTDLRDDAVVEPYASGGAEQLLLSAAPRPLSDFAPGAAGAVPLVQIRVRSAQRGQAYGPAMVIKPVGPATSVAQLKATLLQAKNFPGMPADPNKLTLYFSPVFITADVLLGRKQRAALKDTDSLSACQVVNDDIVYLEFLK